MTCMNNVMTILMFPTWIYLPKENKKEIKLTWLFKKSLNELTVKQKMKMSYLDMLKMISKNKNIFLE